MCKGAGSRGVRSRGSAEVLAIRYNLLLPTLYAGVSVCS